MLQKQLDVVTGVFAQRKADQTKEIEGLKASLRSFRQATTEGPGGGGSILDELTLMSCQRLKSGAVGRGRWATDQLRRLQRRSKRLTHSCRFRRASRHVPMIRLVICMTYGLERSPPANTPPPPQGSDGRFATDGLLTWLDNILGPDSVQDVVYDKQLWSAAMQTASELGWQAAADMIQVWQKMQTDNDSEFHNFFGSSKAGEAEAIAAASWDEPIQSRIPVVSEIPLSHGQSDTPPTHTPVPEPPRRKIDRTLYRPA